MEEGQVVTWLKSEGDVVTSGEIIAEIETDKATMELVARGDGVLRAILVAEGGTAPVGDVIALIGGADEDLSELQAAALAASQRSAAALPEDVEAVADDAADVDPSADVATGANPAADVASHVTASLGAEVAIGIDAPSEEKPAGSNGAVDDRIKASPLARRLAADSGLELSSVSGSGPAGRIVKRDVEAAIVAGPTAAPVVVPSGAEYEDLPLSQMRKTIARRLVESIGPVPHFFLTIEVDMGRAMEARRTINSMLEREGRKISLNDLIIRATAAALKRHPACNAHWLGDSIRRFNRVHIGVAVAVEDGLITPIIRDADLKGVAHIGAEVRELAGRAREKRLQPDEYTGATFSISNLGMFGIHEFTAVINPPEAGILAVGGVEEVPAVEAGEVVIRNRMKMTMSCDHRVIDGALGAAFLATLKGMLEEPAAILV
jgi:pyruvate dehydrogenase E2 component (dihydrolipoamide acetyltransferase)